MNIIVVPDSFKGSLSASEVADITEEEILRIIPEATITKIPIADGGEGTLDCFRRILGGKTLRCTVTGPNFQKVQAEILMCGDTAIIESAQANGLPIASPRDAKSTTTYGVGELILEAQKYGAKKYVIGIGGSATNDGGCGMAAALGTVFYDSEGREFIPVGKTLKDITDIRFGDNFDITVLCDVKNPLYGENGAAFVYAPQKGADKNDVILLDSGLQNLAKVLSDKGKSIAMLPGAGAAGGMGAGLVAFCGAKLRRGIEVVLDSAKFEEKSADADYIVTGEGALDSQSFSGKVIDGIITRSNGKPVLAVVGISKISDTEKYGIEKVFESNPKHLPFEQILPNAVEDMHLCAAKLAEYLLQ